MESFQEQMAAYRQQLEKGTLQQAYRGLMEYLAGLRNHFQANYPQLTLPGGMYSGYMDMTYFSIIPQSLKARNLKIAIVFLHEAFRFEAWLAGYNKQVQKKYWQMIKDSGWKEYPLVATTKGADSILEHVLVANPDFGDLDGLTRQIERETLQFISGVERLLVDLPFA